MENRSAYPPVQAAGQPTYGTIGTQTTPTEASFATTGWFARNRANKPQMNSAGAALFVLVSGGMNIAWSCGFDNVQGFKTNTHIMICWYLAAIIGAAVSAFISNRVSKKLIYIFSSFLILLGGLFFVALADKYGGIAVARYLNGFAVGLVFVPMIVLIGEEVNSGQRGLGAGILVSGSISLGIFLQIVFASSFSYSASTTNNSFGTTQLHGIIVIIYAVLAFLMSYFFVVESPVHHLMLNNEHEAIDCLRRLQRPFVVIQETYQRLEEHRRYIEASDPNGDKCLSALVKLCLLRGLVALSFSPAIAAATLWSSTVYAEKFVTWPWIIYGLCLWLGTYIAAFCLDSVGRKLVLLTGALFSGVLAIVIGAIYNDFVNYFIPSKMGSVLYMLFVLGLLVSFVSSASSAYLTEAFPLHLKPYYIALSFIVEMLVLLIIGACTPDKDSLAAYFITFGVFYLAFFVLSFFCLPETKRVSLQEAQSKFKTILTQ